MAKRWQEWNENPRNESASDCVVRALAKAMPDKSYREILCDLAMEGLRLDTDFRFHHVWTKYVQKEYDLMQLELGKWNPTVNQLAEATANIPAFVNLVAVSATHAVALQLGLYFDTWDSGRRKVKNIYVAHEHARIVQNVILAENNKIRMGEK